MDKTYDPLKGDAEAEAEQQELKAKIAHQVAGKGLAQETLNKETMKQIALFKAINELNAGGCSLQLYEDIRHGRLFPKDLNKFLASETSEDDVHKFMEVLKDAKKPKKCKACCRVLRPGKKQRP